MENFSELSGYGECVEELCESGSFSDSESEASFTIERPKTFLIEEEDEDASAEEIVEDCIAEKDLSLELHGCPMLTVPREAFDCTWITVFSCHSNGLEELPEALAELASLEELSITNNNLKTLPASIGSLKELQKLVLTNNQISSLPDSVGDLKNLRHIVLSYNRLSEIPPACLKLKNLEKLDLVENVELLSLPENSHLQEFKKLVLCLDNAPSLCSRWAEDGPLSIEVQWHKVYPDKINEYLYVGSLRTAQEERVFKELGITHVLTAGTGLVVTLPDWIKHMRINVGDTLQSNIKHTMDGAVDFIDEARLNGKILVHCFAGLSRSVSLCCAYLIKQERLSFAQALTLVRKARPAARPNAAFCDQLREYQVECGIPLEDEGSWDIEEVQAPQEYVQEEVVVTPLRKRGQSRKAMTSASAL